MKATIESTDIIVEVNGMTARVWEGRSERGAPVIMLVCNVAVPAGHDQAEFLAELMEHCPPSHVAVQCFPARMVR
jgi:hypothetical protein